MLEGGTRHRAKRRKENQPTHGHVPKKRKGLISHLDGNDKVGPRDGAEAGVDQSLVQVEDEALLPRVVGVQGGKELDVVLGGDVLVRDLGVAHPVGVLRPAAAPAAGAPPGPGGGARRRLVLGVGAAAHHAEVVEEGVARVLELAPPPPALPRRLPGPRAAGAGPPRRRPCHRR